MLAYVNESYTNMLINSSTIIELQWNLLLIMLSSLGLVFQLQILQFSRLSHLQPSATTFCYDFGYLEGTTTGEHCNVTESLSHHSNVVRQIGTMDILQSTKHLGFSMS